MRRTTSVRQSQDRKARARACSLRRQALRTRWVGEGIQIPRAESLHIHNIVFFLCPFYVVLRN
jgi:hypothetical protein